MSDPFHDFPELRPEHFAEARLFANRTEMVRHLAHPTERVAEIGVALGDFSDVLIRHYRPRTFVGFDPYTMHESPMVWFRPSAEIFQGRTHSQYIGDRFKDAPCEFIQEVGYSQQTIHKYPDGHFDVIYVDGDHRLEPVALDAMNAARKVKPNGTLIFNDYILIDPFAGAADARYGVVQAVNRLCVEGGWKVVAFSFHHFLFGDIALRKV